MRQYHPRSNCINPPTTLAISLRPECTGAEANGLCSPFAFIRLRMYLFMDDLVPPQRHNNAFLIPLNSEANFHNLLQHFLFYRFCNLFFINFKIIRTFPIVFSHQWKFTYKYFFIVFANCQTKILNIIQ